MVWRVFAHNLAKLERDHSATGRKASEKALDALSPHLQALRDEGETLRALRVIAQRLDNLCAGNVDLRKSSPSPFDLVNAPKMTLECYLARLSRNTKFDFVCFFVALTYMERLCVKERSFCPTAYNVHRLLCTVLLVASKATDDFFHPNAFLAKCGGISRPELNSLELEVCRLLDWKLLPEPEQLHRLLGALDDEFAPYWEPWRNEPAPLIKASPAGPMVPKGGGMDMYSMEVLKVSPSWRAANCVTCPPASGIHGELSVAAIEQGDWSDV